MSEMENGAAPAAPEGNAASASIPQPVTVVEAPSKSIEDTMGEVFDKMNPPRNESGKFASKSDNEPQAVEAAPETDAAPAEPTETEGQTQATEPSEPATPAIAYPSSLPAELRDKWQNVPPEVAEWAAKREAESHKRITELGQTAKAAEQFRQITEQYKGALRGAQPAQAFEQLAAAAEYLDRDPVAGLQWLAKNYGVDLSSLSQGSTQGTETSPEVAQLRSQISQLQRTIAETNGKLSAREQAEQEQSVNSLNKLVEDFAKDKPYWGELESEVFGQVAAIRATDATLPPEKVIERAYDRAVKLSESVQAKIAAEKKAEAEKKAKAEAAAKAAQAKKAATVNVRSGQGASPMAKGSWEDTMREVAGRLMGN